MFLFHLERQMRGAHLAILSLQDMVSSFSPRRSASQVWLGSPQGTGTVPSPVWILVRRPPRVLLLAGPSPRSEGTGGEEMKRQTSHGTGVWTWCVLTLHPRLVGGEDAGVPTGGGADVEVELNFVLQPEAPPMLTSSEDGLLVVVFILTEV